MENFKITENQNKTGSKKLKMYKDIFGEAPWNEGFICGNCSKIYPKNFMGKCNCNISKLEPFYKNSELKQSFDDLSNKKGYRELIASILGNNIGFIWGWVTDIKNLNIDKLKLKKQEFDELINSINILFSDFDFNNFYYFAEIGVKSNFRSQDIAGQLYRKNIKDIQSMGIKYVLVRTTKKTDIPYKWFLNEQYKEVFYYNDEQDRVILVKKL